MSRKHWQRTFRSLPNSKKNYYFHRTYTFNYVDQVSLYYAHYKDHGDKEFLANQLEDLMNRVQQNITATEIKNREDKMKSLLLRDMETAFFSKVKVMEDVPMSCLSTPYVKTDFYDDMLQFGNCKPASTQDCMRVSDGCGQLNWLKPVQKEEGNNPMFNTPNAKTTAAYASSITVNAPSEPSDAMKMRQYLLSEFNDMTSGWRNPMHDKLRTMFNLNAPTAPRTSAELLAAFKDGKYSIDQKKIDAQAAYFAASGDENKQDDLWEEGIRDRYYGIVFTDLPVADEKGWEKARDEYRDFLKSVERKLHIVSPEAGLELLSTVESWTPSNAPALVTVH